MRKYRKGDPCPCCGRPIKTNDPEVLYLLSWIACMHRFPVADEIEAIRRMYVATKRQGAAGGTDCF